MFSSVVKKGAKAEEKQWSCFGIFRSDTFSFLPKQNKSDSTGDPAKMKPLELLLEGWFEVECVLVSLWTPGMIGPKTCPPWVDRSDTDPLLWNRMFRASFSVVFGRNHTLAPALVSVSAEIWRSLILGWEPGSVAANWASPLLLMVSGRLASLFTGFVGKGGWEAACCCWACETVARGWLRGPQRLALRWFRLLAASCCHGSPFETRLQGASFPRRTPNVLVGLIWLPAGFASFFRFFDSCLTFWSS